MNASANVKNRWKTIYKLSLINYTHIDPEFCIVLFIGKRINGN